MSERESSDGIHQAIDGRQRTRRTAQRRRAAAKARAVGGKHGPAWHVCVFPHVFQRFWRDLVGKPGPIWQNRVFTGFCSNSSKLQNF